MTTPFGNTQTTTLFNHCSDAIFLLDQKGRIIHHNQTADHLINDENTTLIQALLTTRKTTIDLTNISGENCIYDVKTVDLPISTENQIHSAYILRDITHQQQLAAERITDPITSLFNRRGLLLALEPQISRCRRYGNTLSIICIDICGDGLRTDLVTAISHMLKDQFRWADLISRIENDVFLIALPETSMPESNNLINKIDEQIRLLMIAKKAGDNQQAWPFYGSAEWQKNDTADSLIKRALTNMAHEKHEKNGGAIAS